MLGLDVISFLYSMFLLFFCLIFYGDQGTASKDLVQVPIGPVTRVRAQKFKDVLNGLIQELWTQVNSWRPIEHDPRGQQRIHANLSGFPVAFISTYQMEFPPPFVASLPYTKVLVCHKQ
jgi:hypothetical protein